MENNNVSLNHSKQKQFDQATVYKPLNQKIKHPKEKHENTPLQFEEIRQFKLLNKLSQSLSHRSNHLNSHVIKSCLKKYVPIEIINQHVYQIADRNEAYTSDYAHFLILFYLTLKQIELEIGWSERIVNIMKYLISKLQQKQIRNQLTEKHYYEFMTLSLQHEKLTVKMLHQFMRKFMKEQRDIAAGIFPYYFNLFALVANKNIIFMKEQAELIPYTIDLQHKHRYESFTREDVQKELRQIQIRSIQKYNLGE